ncbi:MAG: hypothetical protein LBF40_05645 [Deltaproteobacteria bacterium]|nr:hypothetical protein [Deltaproteobacteria bacterium]
MKTSPFLVALALSIFLFAGGPLLALPDDQVQEMRMLDPDFRRAEDRIVGLWGDLSKQQKQALREEQVDWIKNLRDYEAEQLMARGYSKIEAYTIVTDRRSDYLLVRTGQAPPGYEPPPLPPPSRPEYTPPPPPEYTPPLDAPSPFQEDDEPLFGGPPGQGHTPSMDAVPKPPPKIDDPLFAGMPKPEYTATPQRPADPVSQGGGPSPSGGSGPAAEVDPYVAYAELESVMSSGEASQMEKSLWERCYGKLSGDSPRDLLVEAAKCLHAGNQANEDTLTAIKAIFVAETRYRSQNGRYSKRLRDLTVEAGFPLEDRFLVNFVGPADNCATFEILKLSPGSPLYTVPFCNDRLDFGKVKLVAVYEGPEGGAAASPGR